MILVDDLRTKWQGKNVRTERIVAEQEAVQFLGMWAEEDWHPGYKFGGAGVAVDFVERDGHVFIQNDEGMEWVIDENTIICENVWDGQGLTILEVSTSCSECAGPDSDLELPGFGHFHAECLRPCGCGRIWPRSLVESGDVVWHCPGCSTRGH